MQCEIDGAVLPVRPWPAPRSICAPLPADTARADALPLVLSIATPDTSIRDAARALARSALRETLGELLQRAPDSVPLISRPGQPIRLDAPGTQPGLSVSHERGLTLAAIHFGGAVGIDLMRVGQPSDCLADWEPVARDYLGRRAADRIAGLAPAERAPAFARAWTRLEASLKCHGLQMQEWSAALEQKLARCRLFELDLPPGFIGTLALPS